MSESADTSYIYLDWAATAPLSHAAYEAMEPYFTQGAGSIDVNMNANSLHTPGRQAFAALEVARRQIAQDLGASRPSEIVFTSGATEADNAALFGITRAALERHVKRNNEGFKPRIITTEIEHPAVLEPARQLSKQGFDVVFLKPDRKGFIQPEALEDALNDSTLLVSIQAANSEIGVVQDIASLCRAIHDTGALFHTDATQAIGKVPFNVSDLGVDAASLSAHKLGGPKGVGALYLRKGTPFNPQMLGGGQEDGRRSTTQNVCGIAGFAAALNAAIESQPKEAKRQIALRDALYERLSEMPAVKPTVTPEPGSLAYLPNIVSIMVPGMESETLILRLDERGFGVSGGSACSSRSLEPSKVLKALGYSDDEAYGELRISFGNNTSAEELELFCEAFTDCLNAS